MIWDNLQERIFRLSRKAFFVSRCFRRSRNENDGLSGCSFGFLIHVGTVILFLSASGALISYRNFVSYDSENVTFCEILSIL